MCKAKAAVFEVIMRRNINVNGNYSIDRCGVVADRCNSGLVTQQDVGLWSKRRNRTDIGHSDYFVADGTTVTCLINSPKGKYLVSEQHIFNLRR